MLYPQDTSDFHVVCCNCRKIGLCISAMYAVSMVSEWLLLCRLSWKVTLRRGSNLKSYDGRAWSMLGCCKASLVILWL